MPADLSKKAQQKEIHLKWARQNPLLMANRIRENQTFDFIAQRLERTKYDTTINESDRQQRINQIIQDYYRLVDLIEAAGF